jgi:hypothetical protein
MRVTSRPAIERDTDDASLAFLKPSLVQVDYSGVCKYQVVSQAVRWYWSIFLASYAIASGPDADTHTHLSVSISDRPFFKTLAFKIA